MKNNLIIAYYSLLIIATAFFSIKTVVSLSQNINYGNRLAVLETQKKDLFVQNNDLQTQIAQELSLTRLAMVYNQEAQFTPIDQTLNLTYHQSLASR